MTHTRLRLAAAGLALLLGACASPSTAPGEPSGAERSVHPAAPNADDSTLGVCRGGYTVASALTSTCQ